MSKNVLVVGMPRSGTSMTTSIFARNGYFVSEDEKNELRSGDEFNPSGYWEAEPLIKCNAEILKSTGFQHDNTWLYEAITDKQTSAIYNIEPLNDHIQLIKDYDKKSPWVWKDPRLCYTLAYWWPLLDQENTLVLLLKRDPKEIYQSFLRLKWRTTSPKDKADVLLRIKGHLDAAQVAINKYNIPHITIFYSDFKTNPNETAKKINDFFGLNLIDNDLGFNYKLNNSSFRGKINRYTDTIGDFLPPKIRSKVKKIIPIFIWKLINPHRYTK